MREATNVWDEVPDWGGVGARALIRSESNRLGASVWELQQGSTQFVYHFHHGTEELLIVLRGRPTVRMHDGDHSLAEGDVLPFPTGPEGDHQIRTEPDVAEYPDTGEVAAIVHGKHRYHRVADAVEHAGPE